MKLTKVPPKCPDCVAHDQKTANLIHELFSGDEQTLVTMLLAGAIQSRTLVLQKMPDSDMNKLMVQRDLDFAGCVIGKFIIALDDRKRGNIIQALRKIGVFLNIQHETCPHQAAAEGSA